MATLNTKTLDKKYNINDQGSTARETMAKRDPRLLDKAKKAGAVVMTGLALTGVGGKYVHDRVEAGTEVNNARLELASVNTPKREVKLDGETTVFGVASAAVENGYLKGVDPREASDFLTEELDAQLHARGILTEGENIDMGKLQPGTVLELPASWERIGNEQPIVEIDTAIRTEINSQGQEVTIEAHQDGHTTTTVNPG